MVLVVIGLMSSAVVISLPKDPPKSRAMSEALHTQFNQAAQESLLSATPVAFGANAERYAFYKYDGLTWMAAPAQDWPKDIKIALNVDGDDVKFAETLSPLVVFEPTGDSSVFTLNLSDFDGRYTISSMGNGRIIFESGS
jgi:type II secretory pathway pseudopilin PulG